MFQHVLKTFYDLITAPLVVLFNKKLKNKFTGCNLLHNREHFEGWCINYVQLNIFFEEHFILRVLINWEKTITKIYGLLHDLQLRFFIFKDIDTKFQQVRGE